jgi:hypothetical protein
MGRKKSSRQEKMAECEWRMARASLGHQVFVMRYVEVIGVQVTDPKQDDPPRFNSQTSTLTGKFLHPPSVISNLIPEIPEIRLPQMPNRLNCRRREELAVVRVFCGIQVGQIEVDPDLILDVPHVLVQ